MKHKFPSSLIFTLVALAIASIILTQGSWDQSLSGAQKTALKKGHGTVGTNSNDPVPDTQASHSSGPAEIPSHEKFSVEASPMERAFAAAREALRQMKESDGTINESTRHLSFNEHSGKQITMDITKNGKVLLRPSQEEADWEYTVSEDVSSPVGYETLLAQPGIFNLFGLRLFPAAVAADDFETIAGTTLTDTDTDFSGLLNSNTSYVIEINDGSNDGRLVEVASYSGSVLTVADPLLADTNVSFTIRPVTLLSDIVNPDFYSDFVKVSDFNPDTGDLILIPSGDDEFNQYYFSSYPGQEGFFNAATGVPENPVMSYVDAFFILRRGQTELPIIVSGSVKLTNTLLPVADDFNYFTTVYPAGTTLQQSNLESSLQWGTEATADLILIQDPGTSHHSEYFYSDGSPPLTQGWRKVGEGDADQGPLVGFDENSGFVIKRRASSPYEALLTPPDFYSNL